MPMFGKKAAKETAPVAPQPAGFGHRSREQIEEALQQAHAARRERAEFLRRVRDKQVSLDDILTGSHADDEVAQNTHIRTILHALPGVGYAQVNRLIDKMSIPEGRRVRGLGIHQRAALLDWRHANMPAEGEE